MEDSDMLITKTPFRISFCGGGSDISDFYKEHGGCVLSTTINKYMYISIHPYFDEDFTVLKYTQNEKIKNVSEIKHSIFKSVLEELSTPGVEIVSTADIPSGTGLGSSSSFTVGLLNTLYCYHGKFASKAKLAYEASRVEIEKLGAPIGKQDQYAAAYGGLNFITFHRDDTVTVSPVIMQPETYIKLQENLIMFYTGLTHDANEILKEQKKVMKNVDKGNSLRQMCKLAYDMKDALESNDISSFGTILNEGWMLKKSLANGITNSFIDGLYEKAIKNGATGGKLLGAGGGGFLLFYCEKERQAKLKEALGLKEFEFSFERDGASVVYIGDKYWR
jgi:D-glycero-alpha-D-manno-heptose-7-phosphate kinase